MKTAPAWLAIVQSPPDQGFALAQDVISIGRTPENTIILADRSVSRHHARIEWQDSGFCLVDLGSTSGTRINDKPLTPNVPHPLHEGDLVRIGDSLLRFYPQRPPQPVPRASRVPVITVLTQAWTQQFILHQATLILGSHSAADLMVDATGIAPAHLRLKDEGESCLVSYLGLSPQGLTFKGEAMAEVRMRPGETVNLGAEVTLRFEGLQLPEQVNQTRIWLEQQTPTRMAIPDSNTPVATEIGLPEEADVTMPMKTIGLGQLNKLTVGRDSSNDLVIDHPSVSRNHARIERLQGSLVLTDLDSCNGTFVNGKPISQATPLRVGDVIRIGSDRLVLNIDETLTQYVEAGHLRLDVVGLSKVIGDGKRILNDVPLSILPREFVAILGPSGSGKSTLLDALNGLRPATSGSVLINGTDLYQNYEAYKTQLGYVPQKNIIHEELTLSQALDYAAQLRMPPDTTTKERQDRIRAVLSELGLSHRANVPIKQLSGGQQRRACMGAELLTQPSLFFLDEVTSGLDPGTEADMMQLLRQLADQGRVILIISHATQNIRECDMVIYMAAGGYLAYYGPPERMLPYFRETFRDRLQGVPLRDFADLYRALDKEKNPNAPAATELASRYQQSSLYQAFIVNRQTFLSQIPTASPKTTIRSSKAKKERRVSPWQQFLVLTQRNITILRQDRAHLLLTLLIAPALALLDFVTWGRDIFDSAKGSAEESLTMLFATALIAVMIGSMTTMRDLVREVDIYRRERMTGLQMLPYIFSKVALALLLAIYQAAVYLLVTRLAVNIPGDLWVTFQMYITLILAIFGGMIMGLLVSALAPNQNIVPLILLCFLVPQIIFSGGIQPLSSLGPVGQVLNRVTVLKWPYETLVTLSGLGRDVAQDPCWQMTSEARDKLTAAQEKDCICFGENIFKGCSFPGIQKQFNPAVNQTEPQKPESPGELPTNPAQFKSYSDKVDAYEAKMDTWQDDYSQWQKQRSKAINGAQELINQVFKKQGHMFDVDVVRHWFYQLVVIVAMLILVPILQRRRDFSA